MREGWGRGEGGVGGGVREGLPNSIEHMLLEEVKPFMHIKTH